MISNSPYDKIRAEVQQLMPSLLYSNSKEDFLREELLITFDGLKTKLQKRQRDTIKCPMSGCAFNASGAFVFASHMFDTIAKGGHRETFEEISDLDFGEHLEFSKQIARILGYVAARHFFEFGEPTAEEAQEKNRKEFNDHFSRWQASVNKKLTKKLTKKAELSEPPTVINTNSSPESSFRTLCSKIREGTEMKSWKERIWAYYYQKHNNMVPCYICHVEEANQIHHTSLPFHLIVLQALRALSLEADKVQEHTALSEEYNKVLTNVLQRHTMLKMEDSIPTCRECNMKAEEARKSKSKY